MSKFKVGDKVKVIDIDSKYYNCFAEIRIDDGTAVPYKCKVYVPNKGSTEWWFEPSELALAKEKEIEKSFTISIRRHNRINLNFTL